MGTFSNRLQEREAQTRQTSGTFLRHLSKLETQGKYDSSTFSQRLHQAQQAQAATPAPASASVLTRPTLKTNSIDLGFGPVSDQYLGNLILSGAVKAQRDNTGAVTLSRTGAKAAAKQNGPETGTLDAQLAAQGVGAYQAVPALAEQLQGVKDQQETARQKAQLEDLRVQAQAAENASKSRALSEEARARQAAQAEELRRQIAEAEQQTGGKTNIGKLAAGMVAKGGDQAMYGIASTVDWVNRLLKQGVLGWTPEEYDSADTATTQFKNWIGRNKALNEAYYAENANKSNAARIADEIGTGTVAAIPQAVLALMTAGTSLEAQAGAAGLEAAGTGGGLASTVGTAIKGMAQDPQYWLSFLQVAGQGYEDAKADGASELAASSYALTNGLINALVEVGGGGIQDLPLKLNQGEKKALLLWIEDALDEGKEEIVQGVIERGLQNLVYGKNNPLFSTKDENAIFNPVTSLREGAMGAAVGGVLGGGQVAVNNAVNSLLLPSPENYSEAEWLARANQATEAATALPATAETVREGRDAAGTQNGMQGDSRGAGTDTATLVRTLRENRNLISDMSPVALVTGNELPVQGRPVERALSFLQSLGGKVTRPGFGDVLFSKTRLKNSLVGHGTGRAKTELVAALPGVIANGRQIEQTSNWKGRPYDTFVFAAPVQYRGDTVYVAAIVTKAEDNRYYLHEAVDQNGNVIVGNEKAQTLPADGPTNPRDTVATPELPGTPAAIKTGVTAQDGITGTAAAPIDNVTIPQGAKNVKPEYTGADGNVQDVDPTYQDYVNAAYERWANSTRPEELENRGVPDLDTRGPSLLPPTAAKFTLSDTGANPQTFGDLDGNPFSPEEREALREDSSGKEYVNGTGEYADPQDISTDVFIEELTHETARNLSVPAEADADTYGLRQKDLDEYWKMVQQIGETVLNDGEGQTSPENMVSAGTVKQKKGVKRSAQEAWSYFKRKMVDSGEAVTRIGKAIDDRYLYPYYNMARASSNAAVSMITDAATDIRGKRTGKGLNDVFKDVRAKGKDYYNQFQLYLFHMHNIDRMSRYSQNDVDAATLAFHDFLMENPELKPFPDYQIEKMALDPSSIYQPQAQDYIALRDEMRKAENTKDKPVFGYDVTAEDSSAAAEQLLREHPEFEKQAEEVYQYIDNLMRYRVDSGLITEEEYQRLKAIYPHYVPTYRVTERGPQQRQKNRVTIGRTVGKAVGGTQKLMPIHKALAQQTMSVVREGSKNRFGQRLLTSEARKKAGEHIIDVQDYSGDFHEDTFDDLQANNTIFYKTNTFVVRDGGQMYEITVSPALYEAVQALSPDSRESNAFTKVIRKGNDLFKRLVTGDNPVFLVRNFIRDLQDAGIYSKDLSKFAANYPQAVAQIAKNGEYWQMYKALGGTYSSIFDYETGDVNEGNWLKRNVAGRIEALNEAVEQAPRLAEFMATVKKNGGLDADMDTLMEGMYNAADVTVNFGRSGTLGKVLNANYIPFLNPGIQGFSKMIRNVTETKGAKDWARLVIKGAVLGIAPTLVNNLLYRDDDEWDQIKDRDKDIYYLFKIKDGLWLKIPKGRTLSVLGMAADRAVDAAKGGDVDWGGFIETAASQTAPANPLSENILKAWFDADLLNRDSPGRTWYGTDIESRRLQNYAPGERYDAKTDAASRWLGEKLNLSPKKLNYLLDQYSGVVGDVLLPLLTPTAERDMFSAAFTLDSAASNRLSNDFYDTLDELTYAKNASGATGTDKVMYRFWNKQSSYVSEINATIREIEADENLTDSEKKDQLHAQYLIRNALELQAMDALNAYQEVAQGAYDMAAGDEDNRIEYAYMMANREVFGAEYAIQAKGKDDYEKAAELNEKGLSFDDYFTLAVAGNVTPSKAENYLQYCDWMDAADFAGHYAVCNDFHDVKDASGKTKTTKKEQVIQYIHSLDLLDDQKSALYVAMGYAASGLKDCPWWNALALRTPYYPE